MKPLREWGPRYTRRDLTLANAFTAARLVLVPVFGVLWYRGENERALWIFLVAAATDVVDGFLARWLNQASKLGALLDPIADKLLIFAAILVALLRGAIPGWFAVIIIVRDSIMAVAAVLFATIWRDRHDRVAWRPSRIGKYAMFMQSLTIVLLIVDSAVGPAEMRSYVEVAMILTAVLTIVSWCQYAARVGHALANRQEHA
jgi:cardiolipin synthase